MFNTVYVPCRNCERDVQFQSKAGDCVSTYDGNTAPVEILNDIDGDGVTCTHCGVVNTVHVIILAKVETL